jgi:hypothetical protein
MPDEEALMVAQTVIRDRVLLLQCAQAVGGELGRLFYGLKRGTSQVYVSHRRVKSSFGVDLSISP